MELEFTEDQLKLNAEQSDCHKVVVKTFSSHEKVWRARMVGEFISFKKPFQLVATGTSKGIALKYLYDKFLSLANKYAPRRSNLHGRAPVISDKPWDY
jgi:hypothetical protein